MPATSETTHYMQSPLTTILTKYHYIPRSMIGCKGRSVAYSLLVSRFVTVKANSYVR